MSVALKALSAVFLVFLVLIAASTAILEYVDLPVPYPPGTSPINPGRFGLSKFVELLRSYGMRVVYVSNWSYLGQVRPEKRACVILVSPEYSYENREAVSIARILASSGGLLVVADETALSNAVLEALGSRIRISGTYILDEHHDLYPKAVFTIEQNRLALRLDKASDLSGCDEVLGYAEAYSRESPIPELKPVSCVEKLSNVTIVAVGDGSLLTNQVLELGGSYEDLAKLLALLIRRYCGTDCLLYIESGKYRSDPALYEGLLDVSNTSKYLTILNDLVFYLKSLESTLRAYGDDPLLGLREELGSLVVIVVMLVVLTRFEGGKEAWESSKIITWKSREDFRRVYETVIRALRILGCPTELSEETVVCLEGAGLDRGDAVALVRFLGRSSFVLSREVFLYIPIWRFMTLRLLRFAEKLMPALERNVVGAGYG